MMVKVICSSKAAGLALLKTTICIRGGDEGMIPRVLDNNLPGSCQGRSPLEGYMKPSRPSTLTWSSDGAVMNSARELVGV
jgi:hypothetical protein